MLTGWVVGEIGWEGLDWVIESFIFVDNRGGDLFLQGGAELGGGWEIEVCFFDFFNCDFIDLYGIDSLRVLVDKLHHVFEEAMQTLAFKIQTDEVSRVVAFCLEEFF